MRIAGFFTGLLALSLPLTAQAADGYYLKIEGIKGEATATAGDADHTDWIPIQSYKTVEDADGQRRIVVTRIRQRLDLSNGTTDAGTAAGGQQRTRGETTLGDVVVVREMDKSTPKLQESIATGTNTPRASSTKLMAETAHGSNATGRSSTTSMPLAQFAINGNSAGRLIIAEKIGDRMVARKVFEDVTGDAVQAGSTSGDADDRPTEEVAFYYNKVAASYGKDGKKGGNVETEWKVEEGEK